MVASLLLSPFNIISIYNDIKQSVDEWKAATKTINTKDIPTDAI